MSDQASSSTAVPLPARPPRIIRLRSSDDQMFEVIEPVASLSKTIKHLIEDTPTAVIPLPNVTGTIMAKVTHYLKEYYAVSKETSSSDVVFTPSYGGGGGSDENENLKAFHERFVKEVIVDQAVLFDLIMAANYLDIKCLLDLLCKSVANMMKGKTPEEIRATFHIVNDYTPEEEEEVRRENQWAFE